MKKSALSLVFLCVLSLTLSSCYRHTYIVGKGPQSDIEVSETNHFILFGLVTLSTSEPQKMAGGAADYAVTEKHSFVDMLLSSITFGIYSPTTTVVRK